MKNTIIAVIIIALLGGGIYWIMSSPKDSMNKDTQNTDVVTDTSKNELKEEVVVDKTKTVIGTSVGGNEITAYHFGEGEKELLFVGGTHGGYAWNTVSVAQNLVDYLKASPDAVPENIKVTVVPVLNPDGLEKVTATTTATFLVADVATNVSVLESGRFNGNTVDLNRNFDCDWQENAKWQSKNVSGGTAAFSEPESKAIKTYIEAHNPAGVVVWYAAAGGVYASSCHNGVSQETTKLTEVFAKASKYPAYKSFDFYATTGDMVNWLAKMNIPAISVLLTNHTDVEWSKNKAGIEAMLAHYAQQ